MSLDARALAWLNDERLGPAYSRAFDSATGLPRDVPSSAVRLLAAAGAPPAVVAAAACGHSPLAALISPGAPPYRGQPRLPLSAAQLAAGFECFPPPLSAGVSVAARPAAVTPVAASTLSVQASTAGASAMGSAPPLAPLPAAPGAEAAAAARGLALAPIFPPPVYDDARLAVVELLEEHVEMLNREVLLPALRQLRALSWPAWPRDGGNPFVFKFSRNNAARAGVPTYFDVVSIPMDLTRMAERVAAPAANAYPSAEAFLGDALQIALNAKLFNRPASAPAGVLPHPAALAPEQRPAVYVMAWELQAEVMRIAPALVSAWRARELPCRRVALETALSALAGRSGHHQAGR